MRDLQWRQGCIAGLESNPRLSCCEATVLTAAPPCRSQVPISKMYVCLRAGTWKSWFHKMVDWHSSTNILKTSRSCLEQSSKYINFFSLASSAGHYCSANVAPASPESQPVLGNGSAICILYYEHECYIADPFPRTGYESGEAGATLVGFTFAKWRTQHVNQTATKKQTTVWVW